MKDKDEDIALISKCLLFDDRRAYTRLIDKYHPRIKRFFLNQTLGNAALSDDLAQETFIKAYLYLRSFRGIAGFSTWLFKIAWNVFYDFVRSEKNHDDCGLDMVDHYMQDLPEPVGKKLDIYNALQLLRIEERTVIELFFIEDMSVDKIAGITNMHVGTVKSHLSRGKKKLGVYLRNEGYGYDE